MKKIKAKWIRLSTALVIAAGVFSAGNSAAAVRCKIHKGVGCNGPIVYEIQLCSEWTIHQGKCVDLCAGLKPVCNVTDFDGWVSAYYTGGFGSDDYGKHGFKFELADPAVSENYDENGQLAATSGSAYTVCMSTRVYDLVTGIPTPLFDWSDEIPFHRTTPTCPLVKVASAETCKGGTTFNNDPTNPRCVTKDSTCGGGGSIGNFSGTVNTGFTLVAAQNQHFGELPSVDQNLNLDSVVADTSPAGLVKDTKTGGLDVKELLGRFKPASDGKGSSVSGNASSSGSSLGSGPTTSAVGSGAGVNAEQAYASAGSNSKDAYGSAGGGHGASAGGASWFGGSAGAASGAAVAGGASGEVAFGKDGVGRGPASTGGTLNIEDPANYFMMSDIGVSLFKRVTAQCRRKEKELVLPTTSGL